MACENTNLRGYFLPYLSPSHFMPHLQIAKLFASRGVHVTFLITPQNSLLFRDSVAELAAAGYPITLDYIDFPSREVGLPEGVESFSSVTTREDSGRVFRGFLMLQGPMVEKVRAANPDFIVADLHCFWAFDIGIPALIYHGRAHFALCAEDSIYRHAPHKAAQSDSDPFLLPGLSEAICMTRSEIPDWMRPEHPYFPFVKKTFEGDDKSYGVLVNSFDELEGEYGNYYRAVLGKKAWAIGPIQSHFDIVLKPNTAQKSNKKHPCFEWLHKMEARKVVYVSFGSLSVFSSVQLFEIAWALESSGHPFIWVVRTEKSDEEEWLPKGFETRIAAQNMGVLIKGWAPQMEILEHPAIGGFVGHCGWNSVLEAAMTGVPLVTWPLSAEHFYNRRLVMDVLKIGVDIGNKKWGTMIEEIEEVIRRDRIEKAIGELMGEGAEAEERRRRADELSSAAKKAVEEGGSSRNNLSAVIEELRQLKMANNHTIAQEN